MDPRYFPIELRKQLSVSGRQLHEQLGESEIRGVVRQVLFGANIRTATEKLTRRRILELGLGLLSMSFERGQVSEELGDELLARYGSLKARGTSNDDRKLIEWSLGLTKKQSVNVLRGSEEATDAYLEELGRDLLDISTLAQEKFGPVHQFLGLTEDSPVKNWHQLLEFMLAMGAQTLATRGSEKSLYGKYFEKLVLGTALSACGLTFSTSETLEAGSFWLSTRGDKRESDATAMWQNLQVVRFDIGFIGQGNSEISLDKVSRFERDTEILGQKAFARTIVIVDSIGPASRIFKAAEAINGHLIEMRNPFWVRDLGEILSKCFEDYTSPFAGLDDESYFEYLGDSVTGAPMVTFLQYAEV